MSTVISSWANSDPASAAQYLRSLPSGGSRESATVSFINQTASGFPELAAPWAASLADERSRFDMIETVARQWLETDRTAAQAWLQTITLPEDRRRALFQ